MWLGRHRLRSGAVLAAAGVALTLGAGCGARGDAAGGEAAGIVPFEDRELGLAGGHPAGWDRARSLTNILLPREVLALASYPLRRGDRAGECAPRTTLRDLPADGAFIWLTEYRPPRGDVWAEVRRESFPPRPNHFEVRRSDLTRNVRCHAGPAYVTSFAAADRPFDLFVAFGERAPDARLAEVEAILDGLELETLPPPPPDPYAGWPLLTDHPGDSLRPPPGWPAAAALFRPAETPRPRALFFASNRPLYGLPSRFAPHVDRLSGPLPEPALANHFLADGVLLWVVEEGERPAVAAGFPPIGRNWPSRDDFESQAPPAVAPQVSWLRASGSFSGHRFSMWIATGPAADEGDVELAFKSAASLAVSGCWRDGFDDCP